MTKSEKTRQLILERAAALFNQKGYSGTSMSDIMKATGLTKGGLYGNFNSKEEISVAAFEHAVEIVNHKVGKRTYVIYNTIDKLKAVVYFYKEHIFNPPVAGGCPILNTSIEADDNNPKLKEKVVEALDYWHGRIVLTISKGIERKEMKPNVDADKFATCFIGTLEGGIMMARIYKDGQKFDVLAEQLLQQIELLKV
ncbi:MAG: TetR/AcrR family transcriptional regulator [Saprospiraceae bacterium]